MTQVIDAFMFFNELDLLEVRLNEMNNYADRFVLCEAAQTHSGKPRELVFEANKQRYAKFLDRITYVVVPEFPAHLAPIYKENFHRNALVSEEAQIKDGDVLIISDLDEFPDMRNVKISSIDEPRVFLQRSAYYYFNNLIEDPLNHKFTKTSIITKYKRGFIPQEPRNKRADLTPIGGGWHFSFLGGAAAIQKKIDAFLHQELNQARFTTIEEIQKRLAENRDPFDRDFRFNPVPLDYTFPSYLLENQEKFKHLLREV